jgi:hypothetical protein
MCVCNRQHSCATYLEKQLPVSPAAPLPESELHFLAPSSYVRIDASIRKLKRWGLSMNRGCILARGDAVQAIGVMVARALPSSLGASSKIQPLCIDRPLAVPALVCIAQNCDTSPAAEERRQPLAGGGNATKIQSVSSQLFGIQQ